MERMCHMSDYEFTFWSMNHSREKMMINPTESYQFIGYKESSLWIDYLNYPAGSKENILISKTDGLLFVNNNFTSHFHSNNRHGKKKSGGLNSNICNDRYITNHDIHTDVLILKEGNHLPGLSGQILRHPAITDPYLTN